MSIQAYHVSSEDNLQFIKPNICDSKIWDGLAFGLRAACFTTTLWRNDLPTISTYPRDFNTRYQGYRYTMTFQPDEYYKFQMAKTRMVTGETEGCQVHYVLVPRSTAMGKFMAAFIRACEPSNASMEDHEWDTFFPSGKANVYSGSGAACNRYFVNVLFVNQVPVDFKDRVQVRHYGEDKSREKPAQDRWISTMLQEAKRNERIQEALSTLAKWHTRKFELMLGIYQSTRPNSTSSTRQLKKRAKQMVQYIKQVQICIDEINTLEDQDTGSGEETDDDVHDLEAGVSSLAIGAPC